MKRILLLLLFIAAVCANAVEVRIKLKDGSNVFGILVWQNDKQMGIATSKDGRAAMRAVDKKDIVDIADVTAEHEAEIARFKAMAAESEKRTEETKKLMELIKKEQKKPSVPQNVLITKSTKERIEKDIAAAEEELRRRQKDVPEVQELLDDFLRQRPTTLKSLEQRKQLNRKENELRVQLKGAQIAVEIAKAKVKALRDELGLVNQRLDKLEKQKNDSVK